VKLWVLLAKKLLPQPDIYGGLTNDKLQGCAGVVKRVVAKAAVAGNALVVCGGGGARKEQRRAVI
jgi:hypothetical protein